MSILQIIKDFAWGGCALNPSVKYSIAGHNHKDHLPQDTNITVICPQFIDCRKNVIIFEDFYKIRNVLLIALHKKILISLGIQKSLHTTPIVVEFKKNRKVRDYALYIDDIDVDDMPAIKKLIDILLRQFGKNFKAVLLPVYSNGINHGAKNHKDLAEKSRELIEFAVSKGLTVFALAHPVIPQWCYNLHVVPVPKILKTLEEDVN